MDNIRNQLLALKHAGHPGWDRQAEALIIKALNPADDSKPVPAFVEFYLDNQAALHGMAKDTASRKG